MLNSSPPLALPDSDNDKIAAYFLKVSSAGLGDALGVDSGVEADTVTLEADAPPRPPNLNVSLGMVGRVSWG